jgi:hypothetical protein
MAGIRVMSELPKSLSLKPSKLKWIVLLAIFMTFTIIFLTVPSIRADLHPILNFACIALFASAAAGSAALLALGLNILHLDSDGFGYRSIWGTKKYSWNGVSVFSVLTLTRVGSVVGFDIADNVDLSTATKIVSSANRSLNMPEHTLPDTYGMSANELCDLMNKWRDQSRLK